MQLRHCIVPSEEIPDPLMNQMLNLIDEYKNFKYRVIFNDIWRYKSPILEGPYEPPTRMKKMLVSLRTRLPSSFSTLQVDTFLDTIQTRVTSWEKESSTPIVKCDISNAINN